MNALNYFPRNPEKAGSFRVVASKPDEKPEKCADCGKELTAVAMAGFVGKCCDACHARRLEEASSSGEQHGELQPVPEKKWHQSRWVWIAAVVAVLAVACLFAAPGVKRRYARWSAGRHVQRAAESFANGDFTHAVLDARSALDISPLNVEATRIIAKSLDATGAPAAVMWRRKLESILPGDPENITALAKAALRDGDRATAEQFIAIVKPSDRNTAAYHDVAARLAIVDRDATEAEAHWKEAARLDPKEERYKVNLAVLQINFAGGGARREALDALQEISAESESGRAARRALLADAMARGDVARAREVATALASGSDAAFHDRLIRLSMLRALNDPEATPLLLQLKEAAVSNPEELYQMLMWLNEHDLALMVLEWVAQWPREMIARPPVSISVADARERSLDWEGIEDTLYAATWGEYEHLRLAYRTRALDHLSEPEKAKDAWDAALLAAGRRAKSLDSLAKLAAAWGWEQRAEDALWKISATELCPRWVLEKLWGCALKRTSTQQLHRLSRLMVNADPKGIESRNDAIFLGLLLRSPESELHEQAEALQKEAPENPNVIATYGLSLYQRAHADEAVALMQTLTPEQLRVPGTARYYGIFLSATTKRAEAEEFLGLGEGGFVLPEEVALIGQARTAAAFTPSYIFRRANGATWTPTPSGK